jgi:hypothetical protein
MKLARLVDERLHGALNKLSKEALPLKTAFKLKGITKIVNEEFAKYDEVRQESLKRHGEKNAEGELILNDQGNVELSKEGMQAFLLELSELANVEIDCPTIKISELGDNICLTLQDVEMLDGIIIED